MKRLFYILLILLTGCNTIEVRKQLQDIESYIAERPDSALSAIESIDRTALKTRGLRAHHALLHAMALDKNYIDVTDDSLAHIAVDYYKKRGSKKNLARSRYYLALSYYYDKQYDKSIIELAKAEPVAEANDSLYLGFVKILQASIYSKNYNETAELEALEKALEIYTAINASYYINVAKQGLVGAYISTEQYHEAEKIIDELINSGELNHKMQLQITGDNAFLLATRPDADYFTASETYEIVESQGGHLSMQDY